MAAMITTNRSGMFWRIVSHPLLLIMSFLMIIVAGRYMATLFYQNLWAGFVNGELYGFLGVTGILILIVNFLLHSINRWSSKSNAIVGLIGTLLILLSVVVFFTTTSWAYIVESFYNPVSIIGILCFLFLCICATTRNVLTILRRKQKV